MNSIIRKLSLIYIFLIPFYDIPKTPIGGIAVSGIIMLLIFVFSFIQAIVTKKKIYINIEMLKSIIPLIVAFLISSLINSDLFFDKSFNHIIFYIYSFIIYTVGTYLVINRYGSKKFSKILSYATMVIVIIGFIEMLTFYIYGASAYANFLNHGTNIGIHSGIPRLRSTFNEPSHVAMFLLSTYPIIIYSENKVAIILSTIAFFLTLSSSAFVGLGIAVIIMLPFIIIKMKKIKLKSIRNILIILIIVIPVIYFIFPTIGGLINKITNVQSSDGTRYNAWLTSWELIKEAPIFGYGPASYYYYMKLGVFSWYLQIMVESGILGLIGLLFLFLPVIRISLNHNDKLTLFFLIAYLGQMISMNHYYIPGIWILMGFIYARNKESLEENTSQLERL